MYKIEIMNLTDSLVQSEAFRKDEDTLIEQQKVKQATIRNYWQNYIRGDAQQNKRLNQLNIKLQKVCSWRGVYNQPTADLCNLWRKQ